MLKKLFLLVVIATFVSCETDTNAPREGVFEGDVVLRSQQEVDDFGSENYHTINGNLWVYSPLEITDVAISSISPLATLTSVGGNVQLEGDYQLNSLEGLHNITTVGGNRIEVLLPNLNSLEGFPKIADLSGVDLTIRSNEMSSLIGMEDLTRVNDLFINNCSMLETLDGMENLADVNSMQIQNNDSLDDFCAFQNLFTNSIIPNAPIISGNLFNPTVQNIVDGICTQNSFEGDVVLLSQQEVNDFGANNYTNINGNLTIGTTGVPTDITTLAPLNSLVAISQAFELRENHSLTSLEGLENLQTIGDQLLVGYNMNLFSLKGLNNLERVGLLVIDNGVLTSIEDLHNLSNIEGAFLLSEGSLVNFKGLENITTIKGDFTLEAPKNLASFEGLENLERIEGDFSFNTLNNLTNTLASLSGLEKLESISGSLRIVPNENFVSLNGFEALNSVEDVIVGSIVSEITDFCGLSNLLTNGTYRSMTILFNPYSPSAQDIIDGNCRQ
ncbi:hypothetical protein ACFQ1M_13385 [Sungkyunkwania multivorans]|uniref:Receptor L-domain domain-containing protein n=1 Tax=Sungkyunkwania multivorans TaxID=1173618 RepID=A0ABW3D084_9FLAO